MAKANHTTDEITLTPQQLAAFQTTGVNLVDQDGNFIGNITTAIWRNTADEDATTARDEAQQSLAFLTSVLGQNPGHLDLEPPAVLGLHNILEDISARLNL